MPIDFPNNPTLNDTYSFADLTWRWDGQKWVSVAAGGGSSLIEAARFYVSATAGSFTTTATTVPFDTEEFAQSWATNTSGEVELTTGIYLLLADVTIDEAAGNNRTEFGSHMETDSSGSWVDLPGTQRRHYSRNNAQGAQSASISTVVSFSSTASVRVLSRRQVGSSTGEWLVNGSSITIVRLAAS
jgi:hypothetical protein